ncbi:MAG: chloride channel protein, partial [Polyangiaceae bacterium]
MEAVLKNKSRVGLRVAIFKPISAAIAVGSGGPFGAEGPIIQTGGALGSLIGQTMKMTAKERRILLACGGAAGMVGIFNTPIAGVALALELLLFEFRARSLVPVIIASAVAAACRTLLLGSAPMFNIGTFPGIGGPLDLLWFVPLGIIVGVGSVIISKLLYIIEEFFDHLKVDMLFKPALGAVVLGLVANKLTKPKNEEDEGERKKNAYAVSSALIVGIALSFAWAKVGVEYFSNMLNWMQSASLLTLIGGLRGVATRLTLWLALLGASLATAQGKHINIDVVMRFLSPRLRIPVAVIGWVAAATMCTAGVWVFFDHIAIEAFHAPAIEPCAADANQSCDVAPGKKISFVEQAMGTDLFLVGRQISLDFSTLPKVIVGTKYSDYMKGPEWNAWLDA